MERFLIDGQISCSKRYVGWDAEKVRKAMEEYLLHWKRLQKIRHLSVIGGIALLVMFIVMLLAL